MSEAVDRANLISRIGAAVTEYAQSKQSEYDARATLIQAILDAVDLAYPAAPQEKPE